MHPIQRFAHKRPRLLFAIAAGVCISLALPSDWNLVTRALTGWNAAVWSYLCLMGWMMLRATPAQARSIAEQEDESAVAVLVILSIAAAISLLAIVVELAATKQLSARERVFHYVFTGATILGSWFLVGTIFAFHYAHLFYRAPQDHRALAFPDHECHPDYWDFLYFSFTIAVAVQTSDVTVMNRTTRKAVLAQSVLSFLFNAAILGLSINIAAGLVGT